MEKVWIIEKCFTGDYCYLVEIIPDEDMTAHDFKLAEITFTTEEISPIQVLFR